jgi:hypothetical protein
MTTPQDPQDPQNPYGEPSASTPPTAPAYGQPAQPPYGQPPYAQTPYGQPAYPMGAPVDQPSKALAITSLVLSFIACTIIAGIVSIVLALMVLSRSKDGRDHGKGMAIAGLVISVLAILGTIGVVALGVVYSNSLVSVDELEAGQCITADGLTTDDEDVTNIETISCSEPHDGEVLATHTLTADEAENYDGALSNELCTAAVTDAGKMGVLNETVNFVGLTQTLTPSGGDALACVAFNVDGEELRAPL